MTDEEIKLIETRLKDSQPGKWKAFIEGRDHSSGSNFIRTGIGTDEENDIELTGAIEGDLDFIANARQDIPKLLAEIRRLKSL